MSDLEAEALLLARLRSPQAPVRDRAFAELFEQLRRPIFRLCLHTLGRRAEAEEAMQATFAAVAPVGSRLPRAGQQPARALDDRPARPSCPILDPEERRILASMCDDALRAIDDLVVEIDLAKAMIEESERTGRPLDPDFLGTRE